MRRAQAGAGGAAQRAESGRGAALGGRSASLAAGVAAGLIAFLVDRLLSPEDGENLVLRWVRMAGSHPLRTALAAGLLHRAWAARSP